MSQSADTPTAPNFLSMSDEEIAAMDPSSLVAPADDELPEDEDIYQESDADEEAPAGAAEAGDDEEAEDTPTDEDEEDSASDENEDEDASQEGDDEEAPESEDQGGVNSQEDANDEAGDKEEPAESTQEVDYEAFYKQITAPFKANGKELQVANAQEAIQLMQMGANYNKKMAAIKPHLKTLKLLEINNLLDEQKLSFLIDLDKRNPQAIAQLIKDAGIDPMEIDTEQETNYKPTSYSVDDRVIELDTVLDEIKDSPTFDRTLEIISDKWDARSKQEVANAPQLLRVINNHVAMGVYDLISTEVERQRMFGQLNGLSDIEAYRQVGDQLYAAGKFDHLVQGQSATNSQRQQTPQPGQKIQRSKPPANPGLREKKRAASSPKSAPSPKQSADFNPLNLPDDEFEKLVNERFL